MKKQIYYALAPTAGTENSYDLYLYDEIYEGVKINWATWDITESETSGEAFRDKLAEIPDDAAINLYINSDGGSVYEAAAIYSNLSRHKGTVTAIVDGRANSAAFTVLQAADHRVMYTGTSAIIHNAWTMAMGNARDLREVADQLDSLMETITDVLMERCTLSREKLIELLDAETLLTPQTALQYGLIDEIRKPVREEHKEEDKKEDSAQKRISDLKRQLSDLTFKSEVAAAFRAAAPHAQDPDHNEPVPGHEPQNNPGVGFNAFFNKR